MGRRHRGRASPDSSWRSRGARAIAAQRRGDGDVRATASKRAPDAVAAISRRARRSTSALAAHRTPPGTRSKAARAVDTPAHCRAADRAHGVAACARAMPDMPDARTARANAGRDARAGRAEGARCPLRRRYRSAPQRLRRRIADRRAGRAAPTPNPLVGVVHRRQRADAHRGRRAVLRRRLPAQVPRRDHRHSDRGQARWRSRSWARCSCALGARLARTRPGYGAVARRCRRGHPVPHDVRGVPAVRRAAAAMPAFVLLIAIAALTVRLAVRADSQPLAGLAIAGGFLAPFLVSTTSPGARAAVRLFPGAERRDPRARAACVRGARSTCSASSSRSCSGLLWGERYLPSRALRDGRAVPRRVLRVLPRDRDPVRASAAALEAKAPVDAHPRVRRAARRASRCRPRWCTTRATAWHIARSRWRRSTACCGFRCIGARSPGCRVARARVPRARGIILATVAIPFACRSALDVGVVGARGRGGVLDRMSAATGARARVRAAAAARCGAGVRRRRLRARRAASVPQRDVPRQRSDRRAPRSRRRWSRIGIATSSRRAERALVPFLMLWGVGWWYGAGALEIGACTCRPRREATRFSPTPSAASPLALLLSQAVALAALAWFGAGLLPVMAVVALVDWDRRARTLVAYGWVVWPLAWVLHWSRCAPAARGGRPATRHPRTSCPRCGSRMRRRRSRSSRGCAWEASEWVGRLFPAGSVWVACAAALPAIAYLLRGDRGCAGRRAWPYARCTATRTRAARAPRSPRSLAVWFLHRQRDLARKRRAAAVRADRQSARPHADRARWRRSSCGRASTQDVAERTLYAWFGAALFLLVNAIVFRTVHQWLDVPWRLAALLASKPLQAALTLTWTATALAADAHRHATCASGRCGWWARRCSPWSS